MRAPEVTISGGGPAGAAAAIRLARAGVRVVLLERTRAAHDKVCGEFLGPAALGELSALGLDFGGQPIARVAVAHGPHLAAARLPFAAQALSRAVLDEALLAHAAAAGADVRRGVTFRERDDDSALFVATGKHDLPGFSRGDGFIGFKQHVRLGPSARAELVDAVALVPVPEGYLGLQPVDTEHATLCLAISPARFAAAGGTWTTLMDAIRRRHPLLDGWLAGAWPVQPKPLAVARIPYGFVRATTSGAWWLGDQAAVVPSFAGAGIGLALASARFAADSFLAGEPASVFQARFGAWAKPEIRRAAVVSRLVTMPRAAAIAAQAFRYVPGLLSQVAGGLHRPGRAEPGVPAVGSFEARSAEV